MMNSSEISADRLVQRAYVLAALVCCASTRANPGIEGDTLRFRVLKWLEELNATDEIEPWENRFLYGASPDISSQDIIRATWSVEGLGVLAWAAGLSDLPKHDVKVDSFKTAARFQFLSPNTSELGGSIHLRSNAEIAAFRETIYAIHARVREFQRTPMPKDFDSWVEEAWLRILNIKPQDLIIDGDLSVSETAISRTPALNIAECESICSSRHRAAIWLMGGSAEYWQISVDT